MNRKKQHFGIQQGVGLMSVVTIVAVESGSPAATLSNWRFDPAVNQLEVTLEAKTTPSYFLLDQPLRIVLDLPNTQLGKVAAQQDYTGAVRQVRVSQFDKNVTRIVLELAPDVVLNSGQMVQLQRATSQPAKGDRWLLRPQIARSSSPQSTTSNPLPTTLPAATNPSPSPQQPVVSVPPIPSSSSSANQSVVEFGQPLPDLPVVTPPSRATTSSVTTPVIPPPSPSPSPTTSSSVVAPVIVVPAAPNATPTNPTTNRNSNTALPNTTLLSSQSLDILLLAGTRLNLRYPGDSALLLKAGTPQQAELVLAEDIRNRNLNAQNVAIDNLIAPAGTPVIGHFETDARGSRFVAQAIALQGQKLPLVAESEVLNIQEDASAAGSAVDKVNNSTTIDPGKIVQIRLTQDLLKL